MKEFTLDLKYISNKYAMAAAVINCIYTTISEEDCKDLKGTHQYRLQRVIKLSHDMMYILSMNMNPEKYFGSQYSGLESIVNAACFHNIEQSIKDVEEVLNELIVINIKGVACTQDIMDYVPKFDETKICINFHN